VLPVGLDDLIGGRVVESARCDFKKTWSSPIRDSVVRTVCAFANDLKGLNGGYIVIGIDEHQGKPGLPADRAGVPAGHVAGDLSES